MSKTFLECEYCGEEYKTYSPEGSKYCSRECKNDDLSDQVERTCENCGGDYETRPSRRKKYCGHECYVEHTSKDDIEKTCEYCGDKFETRVSKKDRKYCSRDCYEEDHSNRTEKTCKWCDEDFEVYGSRQDAKYCSHDCYISHRVERDDFEPPEHTEEVRQKISESQRGEDHWNWKGGDIDADCHECGDTFEARAFRRNRADKLFCSRECVNKFHARDYDNRDNPIGEEWEDHHAFEGGGDYPKEWTEELRESIRERDDRKCQLCGLSEDKCINTYGIRHHVHYKNGNKEDCSEGNLVSLCPSCHMKVHKKSDNLDTIEVT